MGADGRVRRSRRRPLANLATAAACLLSLASCYASNVVAVADRLVTSAALPTSWRAARTADLDGLFESVAVTGDAAVSVRRIWYWFDGVGRYTGAALIDGDDGLAFQTLSGTWAITADGLVLDGGDPVVAETATDHLRIRAAGGDLVLRREEWR